MQLDNPFHANGTINAFYQAQSFLVSIFVQCLDIFHLFFATSKIKLWCHSITLFDCKLAAGVLTEKSLTYVLKQKIKTLCNSTTHFTQMALSTAFYQAQSFLVSIFVQCLDIFHLFFATSKIKLWCHSITLFDCKLAAGVWWESWPCVHNCGSHRWADGLKGQGFTWGESGNLKWYWSKFVLWVWCTNSPSHQSCNFLNIYLSRSFCSSKIS